mgnify:CR=1 FL=1
MGRKVHPIGFRLGLVHDWRSKWFAQKDRHYREQVQEDLAIRRLIHEELPRGGVSKIEIQRAVNRVDVTLHTAKPGVVIGKQGANVERLRQLLEATVGKKVHLSIQEVRKPELDAQLVAESIAEQITRRVSYRRAMKHAAAQAMRAGAKGVKIKVKGRLGGAEMKRAVTEMVGRVPLQTLRAHIDYAQVHAPTTYGQIGVKVWIYHGDVIPEKVVAAPEVAAAAVGVD